MIDHQEVHLALRNRMLTASGLPSGTNHALENRTFTPSGTPYIEEDFVPATSARIAFPRGTIEDTGLYVVKWYGLANTGIAAIRAGVKAILAVFAPGWGMTLGSGDVLRVENNPAPWPGQILPQPNGFAVCTITIPWRCQSPGS